MDKSAIKTLFALIKIALRGGELSSEQKEFFNDDEAAKKLASVAKRHDVAHLFALGLQKSGLLSDKYSKLQSEMMLAVYRYEQIDYELTNLCTALEQAKIDFIPLKGSVIRKYYPEPWLRTSCDIDVLVRHSDLERAVEYLTENLQYVAEKRATHDVALNTPQGTHVELHFDLVEEDVAPAASNVLASVWNNVTLCDGAKYRYKMSDEFFYFYHVAHMAKHFSEGGCGIRPFIDLWILNDLVAKNADNPSSEKSAGEFGTCNSADENFAKSADFSKNCTRLLEEGSLLKFSETAKKLSEFWFCDGAESELLIKMQNFVLSGGSYGTSVNRVAIKQKSGRIKYVFSRMFIPYSKLKRYYPILEKHKWLMPIMQIRRWFMIFRPEVAKMAKSELSVNKTLSKDVADKTQNLLKEIGL